MSTSEPDKQKSDYELYLEAKHSKFNTPSVVIDGIINAAAGAKPKEQKKVVMGEVNEVYDVVTEDGQDVIIRISRSSNPRFAAEQWALDQVRAAGVPAPEVLLVTSQDTEDRTLIFCVERKLPGSPLKEIPGEERERIKAIVVQAGAILAKIHSVKPVGFGGLREDGEGNYQSWLEYVTEVEDEREEILEDADKIGLTVDEVESGFKALRDNYSLFESVTPHLLHGDFSTKHILIEKDQITGIIDFESCKSGDPMWDFAWWSYFFGTDVPVEWLTEGYLQVSPLDPEFDKKLVLYKLRLGLSMIHYYTSENNTPGMRHTKEKFVADLKVL